jgi:cation transport ATPase
MHCASCVGRVERAFLSLPNVTSAKVNLAFEEAIVEGLPEAEAEARVVLAITDAGCKTNVKVAGAGRQELVAIGTLAAWSYSVISLFAPSLLPVGNLAVYFEAAGVIITLILLGHLRAACNDMAVLSAASNAPSR